MLLAGVVAAGTLVPAQAALAAAPVNGTTANADGTDTLRQQLTPGQSLHNAVAWTAVYSASPGSAHWNGASTGDNRAPAGYNGWSDPYTVARSYFQFDIASLTGKRILSAELRVFGAHSATCGPSSVSLRATTPVTPGTTWNSQPTILNVQNQSEPGYCDGARWTSFRVAGAVADFVDLGSATATFGLTSTSEQDKSGWRKYGTAQTGQAPHLVVTYESTPQNG
nr:putative large secreted protein [Kibdelosporangium sp. MJ126-NF4]CTQ98142.1 putative large secreted protein [Kibdelosporangium sp. MJ126-NF4]